MRTVRYTSRFGRDYKRETFNVLAKDEMLPQRYFDHPLGGEWNDHRDCHIRPDLILIYRKPDAAGLELVRLGSHSELGL